MSLSLLRATIVCCALLGLSSCAYRKLIFNNLDWLILYQFDSYLDLSSSQEKALKPLVYSTVSWFKKERLGSVLEQLRDLERVAKVKRLTQADLDRWNSWARGLRQELVEKLADPLAQHFIKLNDDQLEHLKTKLASSDKKLAELLARSPADFDKKFPDYAEDSTENLEFWLGTIRRDQVQLMVDKLDWNRQSLDRQLQLRREGRQRWLEAFAKRDKTLIEQAILDPTQLIIQAERTAAIQQRQQQQERWQSYMLSLAASLDEKQWQHLSQVVRQLLLELESLQPEQG